MIKKLCIVTIVLLSYKKDDMLRTIEKRKLT